jgi:hypothetical protein
MSFRTEWMEADKVTPEVTTDFKDAYGNEPGSHVLLIGGDNVTAIEGDLDQLEALGRKIIAAVFAAQEVAARPEERLFKVGVPVNVGTWNTHTVEAPSKEDAVDALKLLIQTGGWLGWEEEGDVLFEDIAWDRAEVEEA